jgi:hypothetical protein
MQIKSKRSMIGQIPEQSNSIVVESDQNHTKIVYSREQLREEAKSDKKARE